MNMGSRKQVATSFDWFKKYIGTNHSRIILYGMLVGLVYLPTWIWSLAVFTFSGAIFPFVTIGTAYIGLSQLWERRQNLSKLTPSPLCLKLGHCLIWFGIALFPFCRGVVA